MEIQQAGAQQPEEKQAETEQTEAQPSEPARELGQIQERLTDMQDRLAQLRETMPEMIEPVSQVQEQLGELLGQLSEAEAATPEMTAASFGATGENVGDRAPVGWRHGRAVERQIRLGPPAENLRQLGHDRYSRDQRPVISPSSVRRREARVGSVRCV